MKAWSLFYPDTVPHLPMVPYPVLDHCLRDAAIEFCERSKAWRVTLALLDAVAEQQGYAVPLDADTDLVEIVTAHFQGEPITPKSPFFLEGKYDDWEAEIGDPEHYTMADNATILLVPAPTAAEDDAIKLRAALKPGTAATGVDDWLFSVFRKAIAAGAKARLMAEENKPWTNLTSAGINQAVFEQAIESATVAANAGHVKSRPRFAGSFC